MIKATTRFVAMTLCLALSALAPARAGDRFPELTPEQMTPDQKGVAGSILSGPRGSLMGPFNVWLRSPKLAEKLQELGKYIRFGNSLPPRLSEFAILINAREWSSRFVWYAHYPLAMEGGLSPQLAEELALGRRPQAMKADEEAVYDVSTELYHIHNVTEETYQKALATLGEQGIVDLIATCGYYDVVSSTINIGQVKVPEDSSRERTLPQLAQRP